MIKAYFRPVWEHFAPAAVTEGQGVNIPLPVSVKATCIVEQGETEISLDASDAPYISSVLREGSSIAFSVDNDVLSFPASNSITVLEIFRTADIDVVQTMGEMIPGLTIDGLTIKGIVPNVPYPGPHSYRFAMRATADGKIADLTTTMVANPVDEQITWNSETLPAVSQDTSLISSPFYSFGDLPRGQRVEYTIDMLNPDATAIEVLSRAPSGIVSNPSSYGTLPMGLEISNDPFVISGFIPAEAASGDYFVEFYVDEDKAPPAIVVHFSIPHDTFDSFSVINRIEWNSEPYLGRIVEGIQSHLEISAQPIEGQSVTYSLAEGSRPLPSGLRLNAYGRIQGIAPHVAGEKEFTFTAKAASGAHVSTRTFSFKIINSFNTAKVMHATLPITGDKRLTFESYFDQIPSGVKYRGQEFFFQPNTNVSLVKGLKRDTITGLSYDAPFEALVGPFSYATASLDGVDLYDVIYRPFFTPMDKSGGYSTGYDVIPTPVSYPQDPQVFITEGSFNNLRKNLVEIMGLAHARTNTLGPNGGELLDLWMDDHIPAAIIGYVKAGKGKETVEAMTYGDIPEGTLVRFDRMLIDNGVSSYLYFLGAENAPTKIVYADPTPPVNARVNGLAFDKKHPLRVEPILRWDSSEPNQTFMLRVYNADTMLSEIPVSGTYYKYTLAQQSVDGDPGYVRFELSSVRSEQESAPISASVPIRKGWGYAWGTNFGST